MSPEETGYRADIDGLRAIAVLAVVGYHAFPNAVPGGFVGVDIFFVISGFLISGIIFTEFEANRFSFARFYGRRVRRIFPALILVLAGCYAFGWFALFADEYEQLGKHVVGAAGFVSNLILLNESGYFDKAAQAKPLLHLWSLGVEEQFYIVWPSLVWLAMRLKANLFDWIVVIALGSFVLNLGPLSHPAAFYSPLARFWELMAGSVLAMGHTAWRGHVWALADRLSSYFQRAAPAVLHRGRRAIGVRLGMAAHAIKIRTERFVPTTLYRFRREIAVCLGMATHAVGIIKIRTQQFAPTTLYRLRREVAAWLGLALLVVAIMKIRADHFPGVSALLPIGGTYLLIWAGARSWLNRRVLAKWLNRRVLANPGLVKLGLVSYPLYLWHWPLLVYAGIVNGGDVLSIETRFALIAVSLVLACLTYILIERPIRFGQHRAIITASLCGLLILVGGIGEATYRLAGIPSRAVVQENRAIADDLVVPVESRTSNASCPDLENIVPVEHETCLVSGPHPRVLVFGDSQALALNGAIYFGLVKLDAVLEGTDTTYWEPDECLSKSKQEFDDWVNGRAPCMTIVRHALAMASRESSIDTVVISFQFHDPFFQDFARMAAIQNRLRGLGKKIVYVLDVPNTKRPPETCGLSRSVDILGFQIGQIFKPVCKEEGAAIQNLNGQTRRYVERLAAGDPGIFIYDPLPVFCDSEFCYPGDRQADGGRILFYFTGHVNRNGSASILRNLMAWAKQNNTGLFANTMP